MGYTVDRLAVLKILLHSAKYPSASINGLLLGTVSAAASGADQTQGEPELHIQDAIPLFHSFVTLALCLETALLQVKMMLCSSPSCSFTVCLKQPCLWYLIF